MSACPTHAITIERFRPDEWRADHRDGDAPELPSVELTLSTTRIRLPRDVPLETFAASDWNLRPEHPHWPLVWLTVISQAAVGMTLTASTGAERGVAALLAGVALAGALFHLGRPVMAWKAFRNLRRSWLSREVALLSAYAMFAAVAWIDERARWAAVACGVAGVYASARLYVVPGRPAWHTPLTVVRFVATAVVIGSAMTGDEALAAVGVGVALGATAANWWRLHRDPRQPWRGAVVLELRWFGPWTALRFALALAGTMVALAGAPLAAVALLAASEVIGRWLFFTAVVPLNMPGAFWRGAAGTHR